MSYPAIRGVIFSSSFSGRWHIFLNARAVIFNIHFMEFRYLNAEAERDRNAVIETLREKEHHYKNILESLPAAVYTCDKNGYITFFNRAAAELWGREPQVGKDLWS